MAASGSTIRSWSLKLDGSEHEDAGHQAVLVRRIEAHRNHEAAAGDIICLAGIADITIGETIADPEHRLAIEAIAIDEPTVSMVFGVNTSPLAGA